MPYVWYGTETINTNLNERTTLYLKIHCITPKYKTKCSGLLASNCAFFTASVLAQSVQRVDYIAGGRGFDSQGQTNIQGRKITEK